MKTKLLFVNVFLMIFHVSWGQSSDSFNKANLDSLIALDSSYVIKAAGNFRPLVSSYTFTQMVKKDFSMLVTGSSENSQVGKYAAISINRNEQSFSFSPINFIVNGNNYSKQLKHVLSINALGKLNNNGFFDFSNRKQFKIGGSWTALWLSRYNYNNIERRLDIYRWVKEDMKKKIETQDGLDKIEHSRTNKEGYQKLYHQKVEKYENIAYKDAWTSKFFVWTKLDVGYSEDRLKIIDSANIQSSVLKPIDENINGIYLSGFFNVFKSFKRGLSFYFNAQGTLSAKTSLSEVFSTVAWNKVQYANNTNNTVYYNIDNQNVYIININKLYRKYKVDFSFQLLTFFPLWDQTLIGLDLGYQNKRFITPVTKTFTSSKGIFSLGIMFPLRDKEGNTSINIEPFWQTTSYTNYDDGTNESFLGIKFGVPLNQLF